MRALLGIALFLLLSASAGVPPLRAAEDEPLVVIVHPSSAVQRLSPYEVEALFTRTQTRWSDGSAVYPFSLAAGTPTRELFDRVALRLSPEEVGRFWMDRRIRGLGLPPKQVPTPTLMVQIIANLPGSVGYVAAARSRPGVKVVARIAQGKVLPP